ncbi:PspC domain-containing protein [Nonomuraea sp. NPDC049695]|uniref:PspC domain-containing protein n=1 Tax=Nonomuraea sp. NPDC049695 TaxID=3154734 RepID=UPI0034445BD7
MTEAPPREPAAPPRALRRSSEGRFLMGVCAGLGRHTGIDPVVFRVGFVVLLVGSGIGLFLYLAAFLLMKEPNGKPGIIEQWTRRDFDAEAVMALLTAVLAFGLALNLATVWLDTGTLVVGVFLAVSLLAAHSNGVDLLGLARSMPERLSRRRTTSVSTAASAPASASASEAPPVRAPEPAQNPVEERVEERVERAESPAQAQEPPIGVDEATEQAHAAEARASKARASEARAAEARAADVKADEDVKATAQHPVPPYRPQPRTRVDYTPYGEPFAPNGPYRPLDPAKRAGHSPYDPALYGRPIPKTERKPRPRSFIGGITILLAFIIGGIVVAVQARSAAGVSPTIVGGAMLITIGAGLLIAAWWGRGAGLVAWGTMVAVIVAVGLMLGGVPRNVGESAWAPTSVAEASMLYDVGVGDGRLDLSDLPLNPGSTVTFKASVTVGELVVIVPPTARVEVHATNKVGDIKLDHSVKGGVDVRCDKVLEPEVRPDEKVSTIVLNLRGGLSDMEVRRAA